MCIPTTSLPQVCLGLSLCFYLFSRYYMVQQNHIWNELWFLIPESIILGYGFIQISLISHLYFRFLLQKERDKSLPEFHEIPISSLPFVFVIIPVFNESPSIIWETLSFARQIQYEYFHIIVADDGTPGHLSILQHELRQLQNVTYKRRQHIFQHAKAGNINDTLEFIESHFPRDHRHRLVLILDCDMTVRPSILQVLVPYFFSVSEQRSSLSWNPQIAFVQSPQTFYNLMIPDVMGQAYSYFYQIILPAWSMTREGVPCCGTNVLFSYEILQSIHGFQYGSVTEDFNTSLYIHSHGYQSRYVTTELASGIATERISDFYRQRKRWYLGGLQIFLDRSFFSKIAHVSPASRFFYVTCCGSPFLSLLWIILLMNPFFGFPKTHFQTQVYLVLFGLYCSLYLALCFFLYFRIGYFYLWSSVQETIFMLPCQLYSLWDRLSPFHYSFSFDVTPKLFFSRICFQDFVWLFFCSLYPLATIMYLISNPPHSYNIISVFWACFLSFCFLNPFFFFIQSVFRQIEM